MLTSVVHIAGFTVFLLTDFQPLFHFGLLSSAAMTAAMLGDLFMLPNLLMLFDQRPTAPRRPASPKPTSATRKSRP